MKALFIGGTGTISTSISKLASSLGWELYLLNRGNRRERLGEAADRANIHWLNADITDETGVSRLLNEGGLKDTVFDVVANFINFVPEQVERDIRLFTGRTRQYFFISSASAYQKPLPGLPITESTPLANRFWKYSRDKIACEELLTAEIRAKGFPITIIRPSHTYCEYSLPLGVHGKNGGWQVLKRMTENKEVLVQGDGSSLWALTHSDDFAKGFVGLMGNIHALGETVQITGDELITWDQAYECFARALGVVPRLFHVSTDFLVGCDASFEGPMTGDKSRTVMFDNAKLKRLVPGFTATIRFDEGIRRSVEFYLAHKELQREDEEFDRFTENVIAAQRKAVEFFKNLHTN